MKLNLLPSSVSREGSSKAAIGIAAVIALAGIAASLVMVLSSRAELQAAQDRAEALEPRAAEALTVSRRADDIIQAAAPLDRNIQLARQMSEHNRVYTDLYDEVLDYIPSFFRVRTISAQPLQEGVAQVNISGNLQTFQQYADIVIALTRMPGVVSVTRSNFQIRDQFVPPLTIDDQVGQPIRPGEANLPSDPLQRLDAMIARAAAQPRGFQNVSNFGSTTTVDRGALPDWSEIGLTLVVLNHDLRVPDARATLANAGTAGTPGGFGGGPGGGFGGPGGGPPGGLPPGAGAGFGGLAPDAEFEDR